MESHHIIGMSSLYTAIVIDLILAFVAGKIAQGKGQSYYKFFVIGLLLPVIGLVIALLIPDNKVNNEKDKAEALREYKSLFDDGAITREEFEAKKRELMG